MYRTQHQEFPPECRDSDYEKRLKAAYPIQPEVFDRLYQDWSSLVKFQRTRGVLRLMASVIHSLWEKGDRSPLIMPSSIPIDDPRVQFELTRYLSDNWVPVIEKDVDGPNSLPLRLDGETPNLGKYSACRRVARTIYLGSAPTAKAATKGIDDRRVKLGCVMPGEASAIFGDALRRLSAAATFLYQDQAGGIPEGDRSERCRGTIAGNLPMAHRADPAKPASRCRMASVPAHRTRRSRCTRQQETPQRRVADFRAGRQPVAA